MRTVYCTSTSQGMRRYERVEIHSHYLSTASLLMQHKNGQTPGMLRGQAFHLSTMARNRTHCRGTRSQVSCIHSQIYALCAARECAHTAVRHLPTPRSLRIIAWHGHVDDGHLLIARALLRDQPRTAVGEAHVDTLPIMLRCKRQSKRESERYSPRNVPLSTDYEWRRAKCHTATPLRHEAPCCAQCQA